MAEYVEREAVKKVFKDFGKPLVMATGFAARQIDAIPAADVAPVVRCKDCKLWKSHCSGKAGICPKRHGVAKADDFCSDGARMDGDGNG